jgi:hypothetical protein
MQFFMLIPNIMFISNQYRHLMVKMSKYDNYVMGKNILYSSRLFIFPVTRARVMKI